MRVSRQKSEKARIEIIPTIDSYSLGRTIRFWVRPVHTGEAGGLLGQSLAALVSAGGAVLVYTGLALAWRRLWQCGRGHRRRNGLARGGEQDVARRQAS